MFDCSGLAHFPEMSEKQAICRTSVDLVVSFVLLKDMWKRFMKKPKSEEKPKPDLSTEFIQEPPRKLTNSEIERVEKALFYLGDATKIRDYLYLGSLYDVQSIIVKFHNSGGAISGRGDCPFTHVLNVAEEASDILPSTLAKTTKLVVEDLLTDDALLQQQWQLFLQAFSVIDEAKKSKGVCLVHCMRGRSRATSIVLAYLMYRENLSLRDAYSFVKKLRPAIGPHSHLKRQLVYFETEILKKQSSLSAALWRKLESDMDEQYQKELDHLRSQQKQKEQERQQQQHQQQQQQTSTGKTDLERQPEERKQF